MSSLFNLLCKQYIPAKWQMLKRRTFDTFCNLVLPIRKKHASHYLAYDFWFNMRQPGTNTRILLNIQKELLDISGSDFVLINKVGVGAVNGLNSCQVAAGCPESRRGPAEYRTDRSRPPNSVRLRTPSQPQLRLAALQSAAPYTHSLVKPPLDKLALLLHEICRVM